MLCFLVPAPLRPCLPVNKQWKVVCWFYDPVVNDSMHKYKYSQQHRYKTDTGHMCVYTFTAIRWIEKSIENMWPEINSIENKSLPVPLLSMAGWSKRNRCRGCKASWWPSTGEWTNLCRIPDWTPWTGEWMKHWRMPCDASMMEFKWERPDVLFISLGGWG